MAEEQVVAVEQLLGACESNEGAVAGAGVGEDDLVRIGSRLQPGMVPRDEAVVGEVHGVAFAAQAHRADLGTANPAFAASGEALHHLEARVWTRAAVVVGAVFVGATIRERLLTQTQQLFPDQHVCRIAHGGGLLDAQEHPVGTARVLHEQPAVLGGEARVFGGEERILDECDVAFGAPDRRGGLLQVVGGTVTALALDHDQARDDGLLLQRSKEECARGRCILAARGRDRLARRGVEAKRGGTVGCHHRGIDFAPAARPQAHSAAHRHADNHTEKCKGSAEGNQGEQCQDDSQAPECEFI